MRLELATGDSGKVRSAYWATALVSLQLLVLNTMIARFFSKLKKVLALCNFDNLFFNQSYHGFARNYERKSLFVRKGLHFYWFFCGKYLFLIKKSKKFSLALIVTAVFLYEWQSNEVNPALIQPPVVLRSCGNASIFIPWFYYENSWYVFKKSMVILLAFF